MSFKYHHVQPIFDITKYHTEAKHILKWQVTLGSPIRITQKYILYFYKVDASCLHPSEWMHLNGLVALRQKQHPHTTKVMLLPFTSYRYSLWGNRNSDKLKKRRSSNELRVSLPFARLTPLSWETSDKGIASSLSQYIVSVLTRTN